ncbi:MAG: hypothetical protein JW741_25935 [Sedimentisphaerales bacterium]|nr:hypothetical protein [Sedimentisphaerales bacterium]
MQKAKSKNKKVIPARRDSAVLIFAFPRSHFTRREQLYDTQTDPFELENLAGRPDRKRLLLRMRKQLARWLDEQREALPDELA